MRWMRWDIDGLRRCPVEHWRRIVELMNEQANKAVLPDD